MLKLSRGKSWDVHLGECLYYSTHLFQLGFQNALETILNILLSRFIDEHISLVGISKMNSFLVGLIKLGPLNVTVRNHLLIV